MDSAIIVAIIGGVFGLAGSAVGVITTLFSRKSALKNGVLCLLRAEIIRCHEKYTERGEIPIYAEEALERVYKAYHELGGNGTITDLYEECMRLPIKTQQGR